MPRSARRTTVSSSQNPASEPSQAISEPASQPAVSETISPIPAQTEQIAQPASIPTSNTPKKSSKKGCCVGCAVAAIMALIVLIANLAWLPSLIIAVRTGEIADLVSSINLPGNEPSEQPGSATQSATVNKTTGQSSGKIPYAAVDENAVVSRTFGSNGGVLRAQLSNNVVAYYILPEGAVIQSALVSLVPYAAMPSNTKHGELSSEYGNGVQVEVSSSQMGVEGFLVFDTTGGKAAEDGAKKSDVFNRCDPNFSWFNPYLCGKKNKLPATKVVNKTDTIITPIFAKNYDDLVFVQNTIPTGIDGLLATKVKGGDVFIPQKLDKPLVEKLVNSTLSKNTSSAQRMEAAVLALEWGITDLNLDQLTAISEIEARTYQEYVKALYLLAEYQHRLDNGTFVSVTAADSDDREYLESSFSDTFSYTRTDFFETATGETQEFGNNDAAVEATASVADAGGLGVEGAAEAEATVRDNIDENGSSPYNQPDRQSGASEGSSYTGGEQFDPDVADATESAQNYVNEILSNPNASFADLMQAWQLAQQLGLENEAQVEERVKAKAQDLIDEVLNDPNASIQDLLKAWQLAQLLGLDDDGKIGEKVLERISKIVEDMLKGNLSREEYDDLADLCNKLGLRDLASQAAAKAQSAPLSSDCDLVKKTLENYGINDCGE